MAVNPYTLMFGQEPRQYIRRMAQFDEVTSEFLSEEPSRSAFVVMGVRGTGKTVFMTEVADELRKQPDWTVVELSPERDMLTSLAAKLVSADELARLFASARINLSFFGLGIEVKGTAPLADIETALERMLNAMARKGKKVLVTVDEVTNTPRMREFAAAFQIFLRQKLPVRLLMTGLYENVNALRNERSLTFLYRTPRVELTPLNLGAMARDYEKTLNISSDQALELAQTTRGYAFAFQVLGHFFWKHPDDRDTALAESRQYLDEYAYDKIWSELSEKDQQVVCAIASTSGSTAAVRQNLSMSPNELSPYRDRLLKRGIVTAPAHGQMALALPFFGEYALEHRL